MCSSPKEMRLNAGCLGIVFGQSGPGWLGLSLDSPKLKLRDCFRTVLNQNFGTVLGNLGTDFRTNIGISVSYVHYY